MKKKILLSPLIIIILIIVLGVGVAGAAIYLGSSGDANTQGINLQKGLVGHWKLDGNAKDATPNSNDGTLGLSNSMDVTSNLTMWFKADAITGLNDGDAVTTWSDSSGSGNDITQGTAANKPVYKTGILNGKPVVRFDVTDLLSRSVTASNIIGMNAATVFLVMKHNSADTQTSVMGLGDCVSNRFNFHAPYDDSIVWQYGDDTISSISFTRPDGWSDNWHVVGLLRSGNTMTIYNDGVQAASDSNNTDSFDDVSTTFNLGDGSCPNSWTGDIAEFLIYSTALSDADRVSVDAYLRNKYSVYSSSPTLTTDRKGQLNKAYSFDGTNDAVDAGTGTNLDLGSGDLTLSAWIYLDAYNSQGSLWNAIIMDGELVDAPGPFYGFATDSSLKVYFGARDIDTNAVSNSAVNGKWVHAVGVRASDALTLYIDGVLQTDTGAGSGTVSNAVPLYFGRDNITSRYFDGSIDDVRVYNRALSATEVTALYQEYDPGIQVSDLQKGLVGNWKMNGNAKDSTPYANNGTVSGATLTTDRKGQLSKAYSFNGTSDYIDVGSGAGLNPSQLTVEAWFKVDTLSTTAKTIVSRANTGTPSNLYSYFLTVDDGASGRLDWGVGDSTGSPVAVEVNSVISAGVWYHIIGTYDGSKAHLYLNGVEIGTPQTVDSLYSLSVSTFIGKYRASGSQLFFPGSIDDVRIYNRALSQTEITASYQEYDPGIQVSDLQKGLVGQWKFDGNAKDSTPYGNDGTITSATLTIDRKGQVNKAYNFNGSSDYMDMGDKTLFDFGAGNFTLAAWVKAYTIPGGGAWRRIISKQVANDGYLLRMGDGVWQGYIQSGSGVIVYPQGSVPLPDIWYHVALVRNGTSGIIYVNGVQDAIGTNASLASVDTSGKPLTVGNHKLPELGEYFDGLIDDVRIYNRALSPTEITALYQSY